MLRSGSRWSMLRDVLRACGGAAPAAVIVGGVSLAVCLEDTVFPQVRGAWATLAFVVLAAVCVASMGFAWLWSCARAASFNVAPLVELLRYDALAYGALVMGPLVRLLQPGPDSHVRGSVAAGVAYGACTLVTVARFRTGFRTTLLVYTTSRIAVATIVELAAVFVGYRGTTSPGHRTGAFLEVWARWDGAHYLAIAREGYRGENLAFFPLYPVMIRLLSNVFGNATIAAIAISNAALLAALVYLRRITADAYDEAVAARTVSYLTIFPSAIFLSAAYSESLFLALSVASFFYLRRQNWLVAGLLGGLAALTRIEGALLVVPYAMEAVRARRAAAHREPHVPLESFWGAPAVGAAMIVFGLLTFMILSTLLSGDPLYFAHVQHHWKRHPSWPWQSIARSVHLIATSRDVPTVVVQSLELAAAAVAVALLVVGARFLPKSWLAYAVLSLMLPLLTGSLMSTERFVLTLFPIFAVLGVLGRNDVFDLVWRMASLPLLGAFALLFAAGYWIG